MTIPGSFADHDEKDRTAAQDDAPGVLGAATEVSADQHPPPPQAPGQLGQPEPGRVYLISGRVRADAASPHQERQRLTAAIGAVISKRRSAGDAHRFLPRRHEHLLLRARGHDRRVDIDGDQVALRAGRRLAG
jgi:hypothetical protein